jgi:protein-arginine kinase activator protein McsA
MKCDKCKNAEATVFFSVVTGKFKSTRKKYCRPCAELEKISMIPKDKKSDYDEVSPPGSIMNLVQKEINKGTPKPDLDPVTIQIKRLNDDMAAAVAKEDYEKAAKIRDEINAIQAKRDSKKKKEG